MYRHLLDRSGGALQPYSFQRSVLGEVNLIHRLERHKVLHGHLGCVNTVAFNQGGNLLISGSDDTSVILWDPYTGHKLQTLHTGHQRNVFQARVLPASDDRTLVTCAADGQVRVLYMSETGEASESLLLNRHAGRAHKLGLEPDKPTCFYSCGEDGQVCHYDLRENSPLRPHCKLLVCQARGTRQVRTLELNSIDVDPVRPWQFVVAGGEAWVRVYDQRRVTGNGSVTHGTRSRPLAIAEAVAMLCPNQLRCVDACIHELAVTCAKYSSSGEILASYNDEDIYLFSALAASASPSGRPTRAHMRPTWSQGSTGKRQRAASPGSSDGERVPRPLNRGPRSRGSLSVQQRLRALRPSVALMGIERASPPRAARTGGPSAPASAGPVDTGWQDDAGPSESLGGAGQLREDGLMQHRTAASLWDEAEPSGSLHGARGLPVDEQPQGTMGTSLLDRAGPAGSLFRTTGLRVNHSTQGTADTLWQAGVGLSGGLDHARGLRVEHPTQRAGGFGVDDLVQDVLGLLPRTSELAMAAASSHNRTVGRTLDSPEPARPGPTLAEQHVGSTRAPAYAEQGEERRSAPRDVRQRVGNRSPLWGADQREESMPALTDADPEESDTDIPLPWDMPPSSLTRPGVRIHRIARPSLNGPPRAEGEASGSDGEGGVSRVQFRRAGAGGAMTNELTIRLSVDELMGAVQAVSTARRRQNADLARSVTDAGGRVGIPQRDVSRGASRKASRSRRRIGSPSSDDDGDEEEEVEEEEGQQGVEPDFVLRKFSGHRNRRTVKGVNFMGTDDSFVISGSDCGHIYIWDKSTGRLEQWLHGDEDTVNCLEPHPHVMMLATSGIENTIKLWTPTAETARRPGGAAELVMARNKSAREDDPEPPDYTFARFIHQLQRSAAVRRGQAARRRAARAARRRAAEGEGGAAGGHGEGVDNDEDVSGEEDHAHDSDSQEADPRSGCNIA